MKTIKIKNIFLHFKLVSEHRRRVYLHCKKAGIAFQGLIHDISKFSPVEFWEGVKFYQGNGSPVDAAKKEQGFSRAWLHHKGRNKHHFEYWVDYLDEGGIPLQVPYKFALEIVCDYLAAGEAYLKENFSYESELAWWRKKSEHKLVMHEQTKAFLDVMFQTMAKEHSDNVLRQERSFQIYQETEKKWSR